MKRAILFLLSLSLSLFGWEYYNDLGGGLDDARDIDLCADGGVMITGRSNAWALGGCDANWYDHDMFIIKLDPFGEEEWINHYGQNGDGFYDAGWGICCTPDSGAILVGKTQSPRYTDPPPGYATWYDDILIVRVDKNGDTLWTRDYGGDLFDRAWWVQQIPGKDEFFLAGPTQTYGFPSPTTDYENIWVLRIDGEGNLLHHGWWADPTRDGHSDVRWGTVAPDGGVVVVGSTDLRDTSYVSDGETLEHRISRAVVAKFDSTCELEWSHVYDTGCSDHYSRSITSVSSGGYLMTTYNHYPSWTWCLRLDEMGDTLWTGYVGYNHEDSTTRIANYTMVVEARDGFYFGGGGGGAARITKTDFDLREEWTAIYDFGIKSETFLSCVAMPDGGCAACGQTYSWAPVDESDIWCARTDRWGNDWVDGIEEPVKGPVAMEIKAWPNPFNSACRIDFNQENVTYYTDVDIFDLSGRKVATLDEYPYIWQPEQSTSSGIYMAKARIYEKEYTQRLVYVK